MHNLHQPTLKFSSIQNIALPEEKIKITDTKNQLTEANNTASSVPFTSLKQLQQRFKKNHAHDNISIELTQDLLGVYMKEFIQTLQEKNHPASVAFQHAQFSCKDQNAVEIISDIAFNKQLIDEEKDIFLSLIEMKLKRKFKIVVSVDMTTRPTSSEIPIKSSQEIYDEMVAQYPLIRTLKEKLGLQLE